MRPVNIALEQRTAAIDRTRAVVIDSTWSKEAVPLEALERSLYALADRATGCVDDGGDVWTVRLHGRSPIGDVDALEHAFRQEVNDQALRVRIAERTDPIRNLVFALAFSRTGLVDGARLE